MLTNQMSTNKMNDITIEIIVQPVSTYRMRYETENRDKNFITGKSDNKCVNKENSLYPKIAVHKIQNQRVRLVSFCVCENALSFHPNKLTGDNCDEGIFQHDLDTNENIVEFKTLAIQHLKKKDVKDRFKKIQELNMAPLNARKLLKFDSDVDLNKVKLCFQAWIMSDDNKILSKSEAVFSNTITHGSSDEIKIQKVFRPYDSVEGGDDLALLVNKLSTSQKEVWIRFFDDNWSSAFIKMTIHQGSTLYCKIPKYGNLDIQQDVEVSFQLYTESNHQSVCSSKFEFKYQIRPTSCVKRRAAEDMDKQLASNAPKSRKTVAKKGRKRKGDNEFGLDTHLKKHKLASSNEIVNDVVLEESCSHGSDNDGFPNIVGLLDSEKRLELENIIKDL